MSKHSPLGQDHNIVTALGVGAGWDLGRAGKHVYFLIGSVLDRSVGGLELGDEIGWYGFDHINRNPPVLIRTPQFDAV